MNLKKNPANAIKKRKIIGSKSFQPKCNANQSNETKLFRKLTRELCSICQPFVCDLIWFVWFFFVFLLCFDCQDRFTCLLSFSRLSRVISWNFTMLITLISTKNTRHNKCECCKLETWLLDGCFFSCFRDKFDASFRWNWKIFKIKRSVQVERKSWGWNIFQEKKKILADYGKWCEEKNDVRNHKRFEDGTTTKIIEEKIERKIVLIKMESNKIFWSITCKGVELFI